MRWAYLINQYPAVSHSFIRREILALERLGHSISRFSLRPPPTALADRADVEEQARTRVVLAAGPIALLGAVLQTFLRRPGAFLRAGAATWRMARRSSRGLVRHLAYLAEACLLRQWLAADDVSHLHAHFGTNSAAVALLQRLLGGVPYSFTVHGPEEFDHPEELSLPEKIAHAEAVVAISEFGRSQLYRWIPLEQWPKVHVVHCGVDRTFLGAAAPPAVNETFVCVGRICPQKGQTFIVDALAEVIARGHRCRVVFAGDGPMRRQLEERIDGLGLRPFVTVTGWISGDEVRRQLLEARALLLPSFAEGLPVVVMEALALGRPVISTYVAGIPELVEPGVHGWLVPAGSKGALAEAICDALAQDDVSLAKMGAAGAAAVASKHDADREAARLASILSRAREPRAASSQMTPATFHGPAADAEAVTATAHARVSDT